MALLFVGHSKHASANQHRQSRTKATDEGVSNFTRRVS